MHHLTTIVLPRTILTPAKLRHFIGLGTQGVVTEHEFISLGLNTILQREAGGDTYSFKYLVDELDELLGDDYVTEDEFDAVIDDITSFITLVLEDVQDLLYGVFNREDIESGELEVTSVAITNHTLGFNVQDYGRVTW